MKRIFKLLVLVLAVVSMASCTKVPAGNVGVKFYLLGNDKGVDTEELSPGRYYIGINEELFLFPTFVQNYVWTANVEEGSENNESFNFQDIDGLELNADVGITYHLDPTKVSSIFQKYKRGINEITDTFLRNMVRDALVSASSKRDVEYIYGVGKTALLDEVQLAVSNETDELGIVIDKLYWIGRIKLPPAVKGAIDLKIKAKQTAQQRENEVATAEANALIKIANANGEAEAIRVRAIAEADANVIVARSISKTLVDYEKVKRWNGVLPTVQGGGVPLINMDL
jgi:regulator of protease activity HflC (stomatin/prohibitin superfamily)